MAWMRKLSAAIGRPVTFALTQNDHDPDVVAAACSTCARRRRPRARRCAPQVAGRPGQPAARAADVPPVRVLPVVGADRRARRSPRRSRRCAIPELRRRLLAEVDAAIEPMRQFLDPERAFPMGDVARLRARARTQRRRARPSAGAPGDGGLLRRRCSRTTGTSSCCARCSTTRTSHSTRCARCWCTRTRAWGLGDGGAHCGTTCDASTPTFMLTHWTRDRDHDRLPLEWS